MSRIDKLIRACRRAAKRPILERLRFYETLEPLSVEETDHLADSVAYPGNDESWAAPVIAHVAPVEFWIDVAPDHGSWVVEFANGYVGRPIVEQACAALSSARAPLCALAAIENHLRVSPALEPLATSAWPRIAELAGHRDPRVRVAAATLALDHRQVTPTVARAAAELLDGKLAIPKNTDRDGFLHDLLLSVARSGPNLTTLAPQVRRLLPRWPGAAAEAAASIGDTSVLPMLKPLLATQRDAPHITIAMRFAQWRFTGKAAQLDRALDEAIEAGTFGAGVLYNAFRRAAWSDRIREGLLRAGKRPELRVVVYSVLGGHGPKAAPTLAKVKRPESDDDAWIYEEARWQTGLIDAESLATLLEPQLASGVVAELYVRAATLSPRWTANVRTLLRADDSSIPGVLTRTTTVGLSFLPELVAGTHESAITNLWFATPRDEFWRRAAEVPAEPKRKKGAIPRALR